MKITWYGQACFKLLVKTDNGKKIIIITDPFSKKIGLTPPRGAADIVTVSHGHHDHNNVQAIKGKPFIVNGPGEYDVKNVFIRGIHSFHDDSQGGKRGTNTIYVLKTKNLTICHLGDLGQKELTGSQLNKIGNIDVLMIPVGGVYTINGNEAVKIINQIDPRIVVPMHYKVPKLNIQLNGVDKFLKEAGEKKETVDKLSVNKNDLKEGETRVVVMKIT